MIKNYDNADRPFFVPSLFFHLLRFASVAWLKNSGLTLLYHIYTDIVGCKTYNKLIY